MSIAIDRFNNEFDNCLRECIYLSVKICRPFDRVKTLQWLKKLYEQDKSNLEIARIRNEYIHFMRIILLSEPIRFCMPFKEEPPIGMLAPLAELLTNDMSVRCSNLPKTGPLKPVLCHKAPDGRAMITIKRCPEGGVLCYMAVAPHELKSEPK